MKRFVIAVFFSAVCAFAADLTGNWSGSVEATRDDGSTSTDGCQFKLKQEGTKLTGTGGGLNDSFEVQNGRVEGDNAVLELSPPGKGTYKVALKVDGDTMTGTVSREREGQTRTAKLLLKREK